MEAETLEFRAAGGDAAAFVLSRLPHPDDAAAGARAAYVDAATGRALSFAGLRSAALSLASALRLGLGIRRGEPVLVALSPDGASDVDPLLLPPILLGIVAAGCVAVVAAPGAAAAAVADVSRVAIVVGAGAVGTLPLLLASRSADPRALSAEELMDGGDPAALDAVDADDRPGPLEAALIVYSSTGKRKLIRHTDLITAVAGAALPDEGRVCLASLPAWGTNIHDGLALLALGLPAAGATTVLLPPSSDLRAAVATHGATDVVATPEAAAALFFPALPQGKLATLRRVTVVTPLGDDAWQAFRRRLSWVDLAEMSGAPEMGAATAESPEQVAPAELGPLLLVQPEAAATQLKGKIPDQMPATSEATSLVSPLQKIQKTVLSDVFTKSVAGKFLRRNPVACDKQAVSKL